MKAGVRKFFCCPKCRSDLTYNEAPGAKDSVLKSISCDACGYVAQVQNGIARFVPIDNYARTFGLQWNLHRKTQLDSHTGLPISANRLYHVSQWPRSMKGESILEVGSGAGRFTEVLVKTGAEIVSFDYSTSVDANYANNGHAPNLTIFQGDMYELPLRPESFDKVLCIGMLQNTPDPDKGFRSALQYVRPGGDIVVDIYGKTLAAMIQWKYLLRPITKRMNPQRLHAFLTAVAPILVPIATVLRRVAGRVGTRLIPIPEYSHLGLSPQLNREWAILDSFDMYSPAHDHPRSVAEVRKWMEDAGLEDIEVGRGPNGVIGRARKPAKAGTARTEPGPLRQAVNS